MRKEGSQNLRKIGRLLRIINVARGYEVENRTEKALGQFVASKDCPEWLNNIRRGDQEEDAEGKDFVFETEWGDFYLQIKASAFRIKEAEERFPRIPAVCIELGMTDDEIVQRCFEAVGPQIREVRAKRQEFIIYPYS